MTAEFHISTERFARLIAQVFRQNQRLACIAPVGDVYVERADPLPDDAEWSFDGSVVQLRLPVDVAASTREEVLASVDEPSGAATTPLRLTVVMRVELLDRALAVSVSEVEFGIAGQLAVLANPVRATVAAIAAAFPRVELGELVNALGAAQPASGATLIMSGGRLIARFGDLSVPPAPVAHGFDWGLFVDGRSIEELIRRRVPTSLPRLGPLDTRSMWSPFGATGELPFVRVRIKALTAVAGIGYDVFVALDCTPSMVSPATTPALRVDTTYSVSVQAPFPDPVLVATAEVVEEELRSQLIDPARFGGVGTGPSSFAMSIALPQVRIGGNLWHYEGLVSGSAGIVLGGSMFIPSGPVGVPLKVTTRHFSGGTHADLFCHLGHLPTSVPYADLFRTVAYVKYEGAGALCDVEVIPGGLGYERHLTLPKAIPLTGGRRPAEGTIFMAFGVRDANLVFHEIKLIIRTTRGVRCVNLGMPEHVSINEDGTILGSVMYWDDCNALPPSFPDMTPDEYDRWTGTIWYTYWGLKPGEYDPDNPPIVPDSLVEIPPHWDESLVVPRLRFKQSFIIPEIEVVVPDEFRVIDVRTLATPDE